MRGHRGLGRAPRSTGFQEGAEREPQRRDTRRAWLAGKTLLEEQGPQRQCDPEAKYVSTALASRRSRSPWRVGFSGITGTEAMLAWAEVAAIIACHCVTALLRFRDCGRVSLLSPRTLARQGRPGHVS